MIVAAARALASEHSTGGYLLVLSAGLAYGAVAVWHFYEHSQHRDPDLPHLLLLVTSIAMFLGAGWVWLAARHARRAAPTNSRFPAHKPQRYAVMCLPSTATSALSGRRPRRESLAPPAHRPTVIAASPLLWSATCSEEGDLRPGGAGSRRLRRLPGATTSPFSTHPPGALSLRAYFLLNLLGEFGGRHGGQLCADQRFSGWALKESNLPLPPCKGGSARSLDLRKRLDVGADQQI
jgi:hypothetical protein